MWTSDARTEIREKEMDREKKLFGFRVCGETKKAQIQLGLSKMNFGGKRREKLKKKGV